MAAPAIAAQTNAVGNSGGSFSIAKPTGTVDGNKLILLVFARGIGASTCSGFTSRGTINHGGSGGTTTLLEKTAASEASSYTVTAPAGSVAYAVLLRITGANTGTAVEGVATVAGSANAPDVTTTGVDRLLLTANASFAVTFTAVPSGFSNVDDNTGAGQDGENGNIFSRIASKTQATAATVSIGNWSLSGAATNCGATSFALAPMVDPPTVSGPATGTVREGVDVTANQVANITATNTPTSYAASGLPSGVTIDTETGAFGGQPAAGASAASPYTVTLTATNAAGESEEFELTLTVEDNTAPAIATPPGSAFEYQFETSYTPIADEAEPTWSATGVPDGLTLEADGLLHGTLPEPGTYDIEVTCTAETGATDTKTYRLVVQTTPPAAGAIRMSLLGVG